MSGAPHPAEPSWTDPAWLAEAQGWIDDRLAALGLRGSGPVTQPHLYPWSTALRVPTTGGVVWFKASRPVPSPEVAVLPLLQALRPSATVRSLATDVDRGWMLTWDAGTRLREFAQGPDQLRCWETLLPDYAQLQQDLAVRVDELLSLGVPDHRLEVMGEQADVLASDRAMLTEAPDDSLDDEELSRFQGSGVGEAARLCAELAARGIGATLQHDDLHDGNVFVDGETFVLFDWGDACVSHPFHTLVVMLRALAYRQGLSADGPEVLRLRDAYLEPWTSTFTRAELVETADLARRTGTLQRALAWYRFLLSRPPEERAGDQDAVPYGVRLFLSDAPWGAWS